MKDPVLGSNLEQSFIDFATTEGTLRFGKEGLKLFIELNGSKIFLTEDDGTLDVSTADLGAAATPVVRTNNPIVGANKPNVNIDLLDAAIGANLSPAGTRTAGTVAIANTVNQNLDALDAAIGFEAQMSGTPNVVTKTGTIFQMLDQLDTLKSVQTRRIEVGAPGIGGVDFNFASVADQVAQNLDLGAVIPARARIIDAYIVNDALFANAVSLAATLGNVSAGNQLIASGTVYALGAVLAANLATLNVAPNAAVSSIWLGATPGANWSAITAGKVSVYVTFINVTNL